jgi:hypothetical protein
MIIFTVGRIPWTGDQLIARTLPKHRTKQTENKGIHTSNIHALCGIRTKDPGFRASEDSTCLRPLGYRDRQLRLKRDHKLTSRSKIVFEKLRVVKLVKIFTKIYGGTVELGHNVIKGT